MTDGGFRRPAPEWAHDSDRPPRRHSARASRVAATSRLPAACTRRLGWPTAGQPAHVRQSTWTRSRLASLSARRRRSQRPHCQSLSGTPLNRAGTTTGPEAKPPAATGATVRSAGLSVSVTASRDAGGRVIARSGRRQLYRRARAVLVTVTVVPGRAVRLAGGSQSLRHHRVTVVRHRDAGRGPGNPSPADHESL